MKINFVAQTVRYCDAKVELAVESQPCIALVAHVKPDNVAVAKVDVEWPAANERHMPMIMYIFDLRFSCPPPLLLLLVHLGFCCNNGSRHTRSFNIPRYIATQNTR